MNTKLHLVLVRPIYPSNVGFCARACGNMGADSLIVIAPQCDINEHEAHQRAAGAQESLKNTKIYATWDDFYEAHGSGLRIAFTRRGGKNRPVPQLTDLLDHVKTKIPADSWQDDIYLFLGPEDDGLNAADLELINFQAQLPVYGKMGSLNLGHAALLALYITQDFLKKPLLMSGFDNVISKPSTKIEFNSKSVKEWLELLGQDVSHPTKSIASILSNMVLRAAPSSRELVVWEKIVQNSIRLLKKVKPEDKCQHNSK
ncbi:MAG: RNA methyltransferase [Bdellovibrionales bacterium]|nr:RNA methyltransferase [Bdellovibrionales bacterium]